MQGKFIRMEQGKFNMVSAFFLLIILAAAFAAVFVFPKWTDNLGLKQEMYRLMVNASQMSDQQIIIELVTFANNKKIPLSPSDVTCYRQANQITCQFQYKRPVQIAGHDLFPLTFHAEQTREITAVLKKLTKP